MAGKQPFVGIITSNEQEVEALRSAIKTFRKLNCPYQVKLISALTTPRRLADWVAEAEERGMAVVLAAAGTEPQLPAIVAGSCRLPVVAIPLTEATAHWGALQTVSTAPVVSVAPNAVDEAALFALRVLSRENQTWRELLKRYQQRAAEKLDAINFRIQDEWGERPSRELRPATISDNPLEWLEQEAGALASGESEEEPSVKKEKPAAPRTAQPKAMPAEAGEEVGARVSDMARASQPERHREEVEVDRSREVLETEEGPVQIRPIDFNRPLSVPEASARAESPLEHSPAAARHLGRVQLDPDNPDVLVIEEAVDCLLEGGIVAFPTETVYGLAVDATNPRAVEALYELKGRPRAKAISLMVDSSRMLAGIACNLTTDVRQLMEAFWPGPLTLVLEKRAGNFAHVSEEETIGVRLPDHNVPLALMQALARPLACTSANPSGQPEFRSGHEIEEAMGEQINIILDTGTLPEQPPSTVLDVTAEPFRILRVGAVSRDKLSAVVGDKMEPEA